jgi:CBS domain-containing protein
MRVADVMSRDVISISLDATLLDAAVRLADSHVSGLAVVDERNRLVGVITASDILGAEAEAEAEDDEERASVLRDTRVSEVMSSQPLVIAPDASVRAAALQMEYADVHRLFVVLNEEPVGVISRSDVSRIHSLGRM